MLREEDGRVVSQSIYRFLEEEDGKVLVQHDRTLDGFVAEQSMAG